MDPRCARCGEPLRAEDRFCSVCGTPTNPTAPGTLPPREPQLSPERDPWMPVVARLRDAVNGEFEILRELGRGGMAAVYLAHEVALNRKVAIKLMSPGLISGEGMVRRFRQEAITVASMSHPHIITIHAVRQLEDLHFFVMKFVEGRSLEHIVRTAGPLPIATVRFVMWMVGNALAYAHKRGVVHRDVKPANILVDEDGNAIVTDFGIAKLVAGDFGTMRTSQGGQTQTGMVVGTPNYMSPEQCLARQVSAASDQYSLGLVAYEMLTGHPPFTGSPFVVMQAHTDRAPQSISERRPDCPPEIEQAVLRMLAKAPEQRWPSVLHALTAIGSTPLGEGDPARLDLVRLALPNRPSEEVLAAPPSSPPGSRFPGVVEQPRPYVAALEIFAPPKFVEVGDRFTLSASARNSSGDSMVGAHVRWSSSDESMATVDPEHGVVLALSPGTVEITAMAAGLRNAVQLTVREEVVRSVSISPPPDRVDLGLPFALQGAALSGRGTRLDRVVTWRSESPKVATVDANGIVLPVAPGQAKIIASADGVEATAAFTVNAAPALLVPAEPLSPTQAMELEEVRRMLAARDSGRRVGSAPNTLPASSAAIDSPSPSRLRERLAPLLRHRAVAIAAAAAVVVLLIAWIATRPGGDDAAAIAAKASIDSLEARIAAALPTAGVDTAPRDTTVPTKTSSDPASPQKRADSVAASAPAGARRVTPTANSSAPTANSTASTANSTSRPPASTTQTRVPPSPPSPATQQVVVAGGELARGAAGRGGPSTVARLSVGAVRSDLLEGDTVRVIVIPVDEHGTGVTGSVVRWTSSRPDVASVDGGGLVRALKEGATEIAAVSERQSVRLQFTVRARPTDPPLAPGAAEAGRLLGAQVDDFVRSLTIRDSSRVTALYAVESLQDRRNLEWLLDKLRRPEAKLTVSQQPITTPQVTKTEATLEVRLRFTWTAQYGRDQTLNAAFRARYRRAGEKAAWRPSGIRALGSLE